MDDSRRSVPRFWPAPLFCARCQSPPNPLESTQEVTMATETKPPATHEQADSQEVARLLAEGKRVTDPELRRRIRERSEAVRRQIFEEHGVVDWAVEMIRDARDE